jgi:hypothetical protein
VRLTERGRRLVLEASIRTVNHAMLRYEHQAAPQRLGTRGTREAIVRGMPMLVLVRDLALLNADRLATGGAELDVHLLEAFAAVGPTGLHEVALTAEQLITIETGEVAHVPAAPLRLRALIGEYHLVTGRTPRLVQLGMMTATVDLRIARVKEIDQIDQMLITCGTHEAVRVPAGLSARPRREYPNATVRHWLLTLKMINKG